MGTGSVTENIRIAKEAIDKALANYPDIVVVENKDDPVELSFSIPQQPGIKHALWLALQNNDELTFSVGRYWYQWFPCSNSLKAETFSNAISGWIGGSYRILTHNKGRFHVGSELQKPTSNGWETVTSSWTPCGVLFWIKTVQETVFNR